MHILRPIVKTIKESRCYSIMADETTISVCDLRTLG